MKLRFEVDQAEAFRRGIDCPKSIVTVDVNPADLQQQARNLIADRMYGIDVCQLLKQDGRIERWVETINMTTGEKPLPVRVVAASPTFEALMVAVLQDQKKVEGSTERRYLTAEQLAAKFQVEIETTQRRADDKPKIVTTPGGATP